MLLQELKDKVLHYVMDRKCREGGFCFYRLEEPNGLDTYSALSVLKLLDVSFKDDKTVAYLRNMQDKAGSYESIFLAYYSLKSLDLLEEEPDLDPWPYIHRHVLHDHVDATKLPAEITSVFKRMDFVVDLYAAYKKNQDRLTEERLKGYIRNLQNDDGGFGYRQSTLGETSKALAMLTRLHDPVPGLRAWEFIRQCETPDFGFTDIPGTSLSYLEYIHAGVLAASLTHYPIRHPSACMSFIEGCQSKTGGFSRTTHGGIATMEDTLYALQTLNQLDVCRLEAGNSL
jgi:hypothetical protein